MGVRAVRRAHLLDGRRELICLLKDFGILGEEAEDKSRHEVVHVVTALGRSPFGVVLQEFDIEAIEPPRGLDVEGALADLLDGRDTSERQEEAKMLGEVRERRDDRRYVRHEVFGLQRDAIRGEDELHAVAGILGRGAFSQFADRIRDLTLGANLDVDMVRLKHAADIGLVRCAGAQPLYRGCLVAERFQKRERELLGIERLLGQGGYCFFDLDSVH